MVNESQRDNLSSSVAEFLSGRMPEQERLLMLDDSAAVALIRESLPALATDDSKAEKSESEKIIDLMMAGEIEFAHDLILSLKKLEEHEKLLEGGKIDHNGRPWPSDFCKELKETAKWGWKERNENVYKIFASLVATCPDEVERDPSLRIERMDCLNLRESGAETFFGGIDEFPELTALALTGDQKDLPRKCPKLRYLDFRRCNSSIDLSLLAGCENLEHLNLLNVGLQDLSALPVLPKLRRIDLRRCWSLEQIESMPGLPALEELELAHCHKLESLGDLNRFPSLKYLNIKECKALHLPEGVQDLSIAELIMPEEPEG